MLIVFLQEAFKKPGGLEMVVMEFIIEDSLEFNTETPSRC